MSRGVKFWFFGCVAVVALVVLAGCGHYFYSGEREAWRRDAEVSCLKTGAIKDSAERVRISAISGPGICGMDYPIKISALGESAPLGYDDEPLRPPAALPNGAMPQHWPVVQSSGLPPPQSVPSQYGTPQYGSPPYARPQAAPVQTSVPPGAPMSLYAPGVPQPGEDDAAFEPAPPQPYGGSPSPPVTARAYPPGHYPPPTYTPRAQQPGLEEHVTLGWPREPTVTASAGPVEVKPAATLACPLVSALDQWISTAVQPAALRWFRQPVVEIKQISAYSCRGMNGNPNAHISEHAFGNALDIAEFVLADGHTITVQYGWHGPLEEQGFLHDVQLAACDQFSTVLAPGANVYHYNHIHVDLMRRASGRHICEPAAIPGEVVAERARGRYAAQHYSEPSTTGSIKAKPPRRALGYSGEDDDTLPLAVPGED
jgi:Extensin-like protein C-terminus